MEHHHDHTTTAASGTESGAVLFQHPHLMGFNTNNAFLLLFPYWIVSPSTSPGGFAGAFFMAFGLSALSEGIIYLFHFLQHLITIRKLQVTPRPAASKTGRITQWKDAVAWFWCSGYRLALHALQSALWMVRAGLAYILMLTAMSYNVWLFLGILLGATVGYFLLGWTVFLYCPGTTAAGGCCDGGAGGDVGGVGGGRNRGRSASDVMLITQEMAEVNAKDGQQ